MGTKRIISITRCTYCGRDMHWGNAEEPCAHERAPGGFCNPKTWRPGPLGRLWFALKAWVRGLFIRELPSPPPPVLIIERELETDKGGKR